jgi:cytochrome b561
MTTDQAIQRYNSRAILLHWLIAAMILLLFVGGLTIDAFPKDWKSAMINLHALGGLTLALLVIYRIFWRLTHAAPALPASVSPLIARAAGLGHLALYLLMLAVPIIGVPTLLWRGRGLDFGLFQIASPFTRTPEIYKPLTEIHELGAFALVILALLHAAVGVWHQFVQKDGILLRMMPGR